MNAWVKQGILLGFRIGALEEMPSASLFPGLSYVDKNTFPARRFETGDGVRKWFPAALRFAPGRTSLAASVCMPPMAVNERKRTSTKARSSTRMFRRLLRATCKRVYLSAAAQIGGAVLEPVNASPVVIEDDVLVGGNCGVYEGTIVRKGAVKPAAGTILTCGTPLFDLVNGSILRACADLPLIVPAWRTQSSCPVRAPSIKAKATA